MKIKKTNFRKNNNKSRFNVGGNNRNKERIIGRGTGGRRGERISGGNYRKNGRYENDSEIDSDDILSSVDSDSNGKILNKQNAEENGEVFFNDTSHLKKKGKIFKSEEKEKEEIDAINVDNMDDDDDDTFMDEHSKKMYFAKKYLQELGINSEDNESDHSLLNSEKGNNVSDGLSEDDANFDEHKNIYGNKKKEITQKLMEEDKIKNKGTMFQLDKKIKIICHEKILINNNNRKKKENKENEKVIKNVKGDERIIFYKGHKGNVTCVTAPNFGLSFFDQYSFTNIEKPKNAKNYNRFNSGKFYESSEGSDSDNEQKETNDSEMETDTECEMGEKDEKKKKTMEPKIFENTYVRTVYTGGNDRSIIEWDIERGEKIHIYRGQYDSFLQYGENAIPHFKGVMDICCDKYNSYFISVGCDNLINLWDSRDQKKCSKSYIGHKHIISGIENCVNSTSTSTDDYNFYTSSHDKTIKQWDIRFFDKCINTYYGHTSKILNMDSSINLNDIVTGSDDYTLRVWNMKLDSHLIFNLNYEIIDSCCALNNSIFIAGTFSGHIYIFSKVYKNPLVIKHNVHSKKPVTALISIPLTNVFISGSFNGFIHFWKYEYIDKKTCDIKIFQSIPLSGVINKFSFSHNYKYLFVAIGNQMKHGCWIRTKDKNGLAIIPLQFMN